MASNKKYNFRHCTLFEHPAFQRSWCYFLLQILGCEDTNNYTRNYQFYFLLTHSVLKRMVYKWQPRLRL
jgi:hypothetical protein